MFLQNLIIKFSDVSRFLVIMLVKTTGDFMNDQLHFWFNKDDMYLPYPLECCPTLEYNLIPWKF